MEFSEFRNLQQKHIREMLSNTTLFTVDVDKDVLWNLYLDSFPTGTNEIYRQRREFDCSCCRTYIKNFGNVVTIKDGKLISIWKFNTGEEVYQTVVNVLDSFIINSPINGLFITKEKAFGTKESAELRDGVATKWSHFYFELPKERVYIGSDTIDTVLGNHRTNRDVLERSLDQISIESIDTVLDLVSQNSLYRGEEWKSVLEKFLSLKKQYDKLTGDKNNWLWIKSVEVGPVVGRIKNHSIGTLLLNLTEGEDLDSALKKYESVVAPTNYKRPQAVFTKKMIDEAKKTVIALGLENSLGRRFARLDDISVNEVLFADRTVVSAMTGGDVFGKLSASVAEKPKKFDKVEEVSADKFVTDILPRATKLEVLLENKHISNLVSLIAPLDKTAPTMFKWGNNFSWVYNGNIADSMKERVARAGGKVDGVLRFSIQWNEHNDNKNDFDAHCIEPDRTHIYYPNKGRSHQSSGMLDVDIIHPHSKEVAVENITWTDINKMKEGIYTLFVDNYNYRGGTSGFSAQIEFDGVIYEFEYRKNIKQNEKVIVAKIRFNKQTGIEFIKSLPASFSEKLVWGLTTNNFVPVLAVMHSPNYWNGNNVGNKHVIFALKGVINDTTPNGFFNEYLIEDLMKHKRVFEALGKEMRVEPSEEQLSGLGFATTKRASLVVKVSGATERIIRVNF